MSKLHKPSRAGRRPDRGRARPPRGEAARLAALRRLKVLDTPPEEAYDGIVRIAARICGAPIAFIGLVDESRQWFKARIGLELSDFPRDQALCAHAIRKPGEILVVPDTARDRRFRSNPLVTGAPGIRFYAGAPLVTRAGAAIGTLCVIDREPRQIRPEKVEALADLARQAVAEMELRASRDEFAARYRQALITPAPAPGRPDAGNQVMDERLRAAIDHLAESVVLTDAEDRFLLTNRAFRNLNRNVSAAIEPGRKFEDYLRAGLAAGNYPDAAGRQEEWLQARLAERRHPAGPVERQRPGGRWFLISDKRLADGGMIRIGTEITARKRAEAALQERERELRLIMDSVPVMISRANRDERYVFVNHAYERLMERTSADLLGRSIREVVSPEVYVQVKPDINRVIAGETLRFERTQLRSDGETRHLDVLYVPDLDSHGSSAGWFALHWDVTERKHAEAALRERERELRLIVDSVPVMITRTDRDERYLFVNRAYTDLMERSDAEIIGRTIREIVPPEAYAQARPSIDRVLAGETVRFERTQSRSDGQTVELEGLYVPDIDDHGRVAGWFALNRDVTVERRARRALAESEARFRSLTALSSDWYWEQDEQFRQSFLSDGYDAASGTTRAAILGTRRWERSDVTPLSCSWQDHKAMLDAHLPFKDFEYVRHAADGRRIYVSLSGEPVYDDSGRFRGYRGVGRDITVRKRDELLLRLEHQVARALSEAEDAAGGVKTILKAVCETENWGCGRYFKLDEEAGVLRFDDGWCLPRAPYQRFLDESRSLVFRPGEGLAGIVWQSGEPVWSSDTSRDPRVLAKSLARNSGIRGAFAFGVLAEGKTFGVLSFSGHTAREPDERLLQAARVVGSQIGQFLRRKQAEQLRRESEARFRSLTELSSDWYWEQDENFRFVEFSAGADLHDTSSAHVGRTRWELPGVDASEKRWAEHRETLAAHKAFRNFDFQRLTEGGEVIWISASGEPIFDEQGVFKGYRGVGSDITVRKLAEEALREQTERLQIGQKAAQMIILDRDIPNDRLTWSDSPEWLRGPLPASGNYPLFRDQVHPEDREKFLATRAQAIDTLQGRTHEFRVVRTDGEVLWLLSRQKVYADASGKAVRMLVAMFDISDRKRAENALAESEARFRAIFERSNAGMAITDTNGLYLSVNAAFARFFGYSADELVGKLKVSDLRPAEDAEGAVLYQRLVLGEIGFFERERPYRRKDGMPIWARATVSAVRDAGGRALYVVAVFSDITEEVLARERIERMNAKLEERVRERTAELRDAVKELDAFTYSVSHDLRAPVGAVSGFAHLLRTKEAARLSEDGKHLLGVIEQNAERMINLIEGLLRFSHLGSGELRRVRLSMNELAGEALLDFGDAAARAEVHACALPECDGDRTLLGQVWANLIDNALKYSRGRDPARVEIGWDAAKGAYFVRDNGVGFDMAYATKLFGVFERLHHESEFEGSGIGLAIAERIVKRHGGAIWADAAADRGATFWFTVPAAPGDGSSAPCPSPENAAEQMDRGKTQC